MATQIDATFDVSLGDVPFTLEGKLTIDPDPTKSSFVGGFGKPLDGGGFGPLAFSEAPKLKLGLSALVGDIRDKLGIGNDNHFDPQGLIANLGQIRGLENVVTGIENAEVRITVLSIDTGNKHFTFGFAVGFDSPATLSDLLSLKIGGFGVTFEYSPPTKTP